MLPIVTEVLAAAGQDLSGLEGQLDALGTLKAKADKDTDLQSSPLLSVINGLISSRRTLLFDALEVSALSSLEAVSQHLSDSERKNLLEQIQALLGVAPTPPQPGPTPPASMQGTRPKA